MCRKHVTSMCSRGHAPLVIEGMFKRILNGNLYRRPHVRRWGKLGGVEVLVSVRAGDDRRDSLPLLP